MQTIKTSNKTELFAALLAVAGVITIVITALLNL